MKISIGIVNYNRLFYLKSCAESLMATTKGHDTELICIDDGSIESGTANYLNELRDLNWTVINQNETRGGDKKSGCDNSSHINPFSEALNIIHKRSHGELVLQLQGDMQFIRDDWLDDVLKLFNNRKDVGTLVLDAQRKVRLKGCAFTEVNVNDSIYFIQNGGAINGAGDTVYSKKMLSEIGGWTIKDGVNAENDFTKKVASKYQGAMKKYYLQLPASIAIYTDKRGTNARIRGGKRYGDYWQAQDNYYYKQITSANYPKEINRPYSIEEVAQANGDWQLPISPAGSWLKNPVEINSQSAYTLIT